MRNYVRLLTRLTNTPLFISEAKMELITDNVLLRIASGSLPNTEYDNSIKLAARMETANKAKTAISADAMAIIDVFDSLQAKGGFGGLSGFTTYESIRTDLQATVDLGYKNILLNMDSPGGEVTGLFALTDYIRSLTASGINIVSYIDGSATSAAYAIAAATRKRYSTNTSLIGSIAAIMVHLETSVADTNAGKTYTIFRSKEEKALGDSHTALTDDVKAKFKALLDTMDMLFNNDVLASMPQLSLQSIIDMKGSEFIASDALQLGLIDNIVSGVDSAITLALQNKPKASIKMKTDFKGVTMNEEELKASLLAAQTEVVTLKAELAAAGKVTLDAERARTLSILTSAKTLNIGMDTAIKHITKGFEADTSLEILTEIAEASGKSTMLETANLSTQVDPDLPAKLGASAGATERITSLRAGAKAAGLTLKTEV